MGVLLSLNTKDFHWVAGGLCIAAGGLCFLLFLGHFFVDGFRTFVFSLPRRAFLFHSHIFGEAFPNSCREYLIHLTKSVSLGA